MTTGRINQIAFFTVSSSHLTWTRTRHKNAFGFCVERGTTGARVRTKTGRKPLFAFPFLLLSPIPVVCFNFLEQHFMCSYSLNQSESFGLLQCPLQLPPCFLDQRTHNHSQDPL